MKHTSTERFAGQNVLLFNAYADVCLHARTGS
jgi:hypothetical protein